MGARQKLNSLNVIASGIIAAGIGLAFQSWSAFVIGMLAGLVLKLSDGGIRIAARRRRPAE